MKTSDKELQRMTTSDATNDNEWYSKRQRVAQPIKANESE